MRARLIRIGNSRGVRLPQQVLEHYHLAEGAVLELEPRLDGILIRPVPTADAKVSWAQAYQERAAEVAEAAEWAQWNGVAGDGLGD
jgi:antitoxin MazE